MNESDLRSDVHYLGSIYEVLEVYMKYYMKPK